MDSRELASVIWLGIFAMWALSMTDGRTALVPVLRTLATPKLALSLLAMGAWMTGAVYAAARVDLWEPALLGDTISWATLSALPLFGRAISIFLDRRGGGFKEIMTGALAFTAFVEVFVNLFALPFAVEFVLVPLVTFLYLLSIVAEFKPEHAPVKKLANTGLTVIGTILLLYATTRVLIHWNEFDKAAGLNKLLLPVWLTFWALPFIAVLGVYSNYDSAFTKIRGATDRRADRARARIALLVGLHLRAREVGRFNGIWAKQLAATHTLVDALRVVRRFRARPQG